MTDRQIVARLAWSMVAAALAAALVVIAVLAEDRLWAAIALLPALAGLLAISSVIRATREPRTTRRSQ